MFSVVGFEVVRFVEKFVKCFSIPSKLLGFYLKDCCFYTAQGKTAVC